MLTPTSRPSHALAVEAFGRIVWHDEDLCFLAVVFAESSEDYWRAFKRRVDLRCSSDDREGVGA